MTLEECTIRLSQIDNEYQKTKREVEEKYRRDRAMTLNVWAKHNAAYHIGDILEFNDSMIEVDRMTGRMSMAGKLYVAYQGPVLTKQMKYRKDRERKEFYDDGRDIKLVKKAKVD